MKTMKTNELMAELMAAVNKADYDAAKELVTKLTKSLASMTNEDASTFMLEVRHWLQCVEGTTAFGSTSGYCRNRTCDSCIYTQAMNHYCWQSPQYIKAEAAVRRACKPLLVNTIKALQHFMAKTK